MVDKRAINIGEFRQRATEIIREVEETARPMVVARRGRPVVEIRPIEPGTSSLLGSVTIQPGVDLTEPVAEAGDWNALG